MIRLNHLNSPWTGRIIQNICYVELKSLQLKLIRFKHLNSTQLVEFENTLVELSWRHFNRNGWTISTQQNRLNYGMKWLIWAKERSTEINHFYQLNATIMFGKVLIELSWNGVNLVLWFILTKSKRRNCEKNNSFSLVYRYWITEWKIMIYC